MPSVHCFERARQKSLEMIAPRRVLVCTFRITVAVEDFVRGALPDGRAYTELDSTNSFTDVLSASHCKYGDLSSVATKSF